MKRTSFFTAIFMLLQAAANAQVNTVSSDVEWTKQLVVLQNTTEAAFIIRIGDADNLGFGWPGDFDPFCGRMTTAHYFPWEPAADDLPGFDRILLSSKFNRDKGSACGYDGYSESFDKIKSKPVSFAMPTDVLKGAAVENAFLQLFIDDFQAPALCSKFQLLINGKRFAEGEKFLNAVDQTGPVGKLITIPLTEEFYQALTNGGGLTILIDEATGSGDGFALDFIRLLVNRKKENSCKGIVRGRVLDKNTQEPVSNARVSISDNDAVITNNDGNFEFRDISTGYEVITASAAGYTDGSATADIAPGDDTPEATIYLTKGKSAKFGNVQINVGESITLSNILFDQGKALIKNESRPELDKLVAFLKANPDAEIELSGHTSSEGERAYNRSLSYNRVRACKEYIIGMGIAVDRIFAIGLGPDMPVAPNDTEANRAKNRRVEMRLKKL
jgi:OmpA-OmpF porin, OOP family